MTFEAIEKLQSLPDASGSASSLGDWYASVRETEIEALDECDLARCLRQNVWVSYVIDEALRRLESDPMAGGLYDGELLDALCSVPATHWNESPNRKLRMASILGQVDEGELDADVKECVSHLRGQCSTD